MQVVIVDRILDATSETEVLFASLLIGWLPMAGEGLALRTYDFQICGTFGAYL